MFAETSGRRRAIMAAVGLAFAAALACGLAWRSTPPQMGADEQVFTAVDALFTAVTARDEVLLGQCDERLRALAETGKLPRDAWAYLRGVIEKARAGRWQPAAERLYTFMKSQRRDRAAGEAPRHKEKNRNRA